MARASSPSVSPPGELPAAWSFPGKREKKSRGSVTFALGAALLFHSAFALIKAEQPKELAAEIGIDLEEFIPIAEDPAPEPEAPEPPPPVDHSQQPTPTNIPTAPDTVTDSLMGDPDVDAEAGLPEDELAAPVVTDDFGDADWSMLSGHGTALGRGGLTRPGRGEGGRARAVSLQARDLSRPAIPPNLQPLIDRNFPVAAKLARVDGTVTVSAVIEADGNPTDVRVVSVSPRGRGFGETCTRTVHQGPDWKPMLNRDGRPVATKVKYTCKFTLPKNLATTTDAPTTGVGANRVWTKPPGG